MLGVGLGYLHGRELAHGMRPDLFIDGAAISIAFVLFYCATVVSSLRPIWAQIGVRVVGSWVVAISTLVLGLALIQSISFPFLAQTNGKVSPAPPKVVSSPSR